MHQVSPELLQAIEENDTLFAQPRLIAEWNQNRYAGIETVDNDPSEEEVDFDDPDTIYEPELFPVSSLVEPNRPTKGIVKGRLDEMKLTESFVVSPPPVRYYVPDEIDNYKYWISPTPSIASGFFPEGYEVQPFVIYKNPAWVNKIVVGFETSATHPTQFDIQVTTNGEDWDTIISNPTIDPRGQVILYYQDDNQWAAPVYRENVTQILGVRVRVTRVFHAGKYFSMIELSSRLETELTDYVISDQSTYEMSDASLVTPLGKASANVGSVKLSNIWSATGGLFDNENPASLYYGIIDHNVKFTMDLVYDFDVVTEEWDEIEEEFVEVVTPTTEAVRRFTMYSGPWNGQGEEEVEVELKDYSKFFQETNLPPRLYQDCTLGEIVWKICDSLGFVDYQYDHHAVDSTMLIPFFWTDGERTAWEVLADLAEATQTAIFFDEYGTLRIQTRNFAFDKDKLEGVPDWEFTANKVGDKLPDIKEISQTADFEATKAIIRYKTTKISDDQNGLPRMETVWEPEGTLTLRSSNLARDMLASQNYLWINEQDAKVWPYQGLMNIEGEIVRYGAKGYYWWDQSNTRRHSIVRNDEEKASFDDQSSENLRWRNDFSGRILFVERGVWNTTPVPHKIEGANYHKSRTNRDTATAAKVWNSGFIIPKNHTVLNNRQDSLVRLQTNSWFKNRRYMYVARRGSKNDEGYKHVGTRIRFPTGAKYTSFDAGIVLNITHVGPLSGYYIALQPSKIVEKYKRKYNHECFIGSIRHTGSHKKFGQNAGKGVASQIAYGVWYDLDIRFEIVGSNHIIQMYVNGAPKARAVVNESTWRHAQQGRFGIFARSEGAAEFDYLYAVGGTPYRHDQVYDALENLDGPMLFDQVRGGFVSAHWDMWSFWRPIKAEASNFKKNRYAQRFFDEFGPICHEVREFDVKFEKAPVIHSRLYSTNSRVVNPEYHGDPFGAKFILANANRTHSVVSGEDTVTFGADNSVDQALLIYGRNVFQEDEQEYEVQDEDAVRRRGVVSVEVANDWIQSESMAKGIGDWIVDHWGGGCDEMELEAFGNPLIQVGDFVTINYPQKSMSPETHKYYVVAVQNTFDRGLETVLTLRRARLPEEEEE